MLPVELPDVDDYSPQSYDPDDEHSEPDPPLGNAEHWVDVELDLGDGPKRYLRETNTMPQWAGSCWYELRYLDPTNENAFVDPEVERYWMGPQFEGDCGGVDLYVGGVEHAVLHLLYARFWHKVLFDLGYVSSSEPFRRLFNQGYILAAAYTDERGMYVEAAEVEERDGAFFVGQQSVNRECGQDGQEPEERGLPRRAVRRVRRRHAAALRDVDGSARRVAAVGDPRRRGHVPLPAAAVAQRDRRGRRARCGWSTSPADETTRRLLHRTIDGVRGDMEAPAVQHRHRQADRAEQPPDRRRARPVTREVAEPMVLMLAPLTPHVAEELWARLGHEHSLAYEPFPEADPALLVDDTVELPVQVNGKVRGRVVVAADADDGRASRRPPWPTTRCRPRLEGRTPKKVIVVPGRMVSIVA